MPHDDHTSGNGDQINRDQINRDQVNRDQVNRDEVNRDRTNPNRVRSSPNPDQTKPNPDRVNPNPGQGNPNPDRTNPNPDRVNPNPGQGNRSHPAAADSADKPRLSGRRAEAAANDARVLATARAVLTVAPGTPMAEIAARAGVGVGSLYRRFPSKEALAYRLCLEGMNGIADVAREALQRMERGDPWEAFVGFIAGAVEAGAGSLRGLAGTFTPDDFLNRVAVDMAGLMQQVLERAQSGGAVRDDITANDVGLFFEMLRAIRVGDAARSDALRRRYIEMLSPAFQAPASAELTVPPASWAEISGAWNP